MLSPVLAVEGLVVDIGGAAVLGSIQPERLQVPLANAWSGLPELAEVLKRHLLTH